MIRAIIFDFGGVLLRTEDHSYRRRWEMRLGLQPGEAEEIVFNSPAGQQAQLGQISDEALWDWIGSRLDLGESMNAFRNDFWAGDRLDRDLVATVRALQTRYQTAMISNATDALRETLNGQHGIADAFDLIVCSAEEQIMKPSVAIYERTLARLERQPQEAVFIDDFKRNIDAALELGLVTIHYQPGTELTAELEALGVVVPGAKENES